MTASTDQTVGVAPPSEGAAERICDAPGCRQPGVHPAPMSRDRLRSYYHFCLEHVRAYNLAWDYYKDMSEPEIEAERRQDTVWRRPSWRMGGAPAPETGTAWTAFQDAFGIFDEAGPKNEATRPSPNDPRAVACAVLGLPPNADPQSIKARYKTLVKELHPDRAGGDQATLERMQQVNQAYQTLKKYFTR
jgi:DnaJ-domain-containing protein 1